MRSWPRPLSAAQRRVGVMRGGVRKVSGMPPGFASQCPYGLALPIPIVPWILGAWVAVYALWAETALLGLGLLSLRLRRTRVPRSSSVSLLFVTGCAGGALAVAEWITRYNIQSCAGFPLLVHITLPEIVQVRHLQAQSLMQGEVTLGVLAATVLVATALTVTALARSWRGSKRENATALA